MRQMAVHQPSHLAAPRAANRLRPKRLPQCCGISQPVSLCRWPSLEDIVSPPSSVGAAKELPARKAKRWRDKGICIWSGW